MGGDGVAIGGHDLKGAIGKVDDDVFAQVSTKPFLLSIRPQSIDEFLQPRKSKECLLSPRRVFPNNYIVEEDGGNLLFKYASAGEILGSVFANFGPEVGLNFPPNFIQGSRLVC